MLINLAVSLIGALIFLFLFWRRLKEDYSSNVLFTTGFFVIFGIAIGVLISLRFSPLWWFWLAGVGVVIGFFVGYLKFKFRTFEVLEALFVSTLPWLILIFLYDSISKSSLISLLFSILIVAVIALFYWLDASYKNFLWYKSGRVGFAGLMSMGVLFLIRATIASFLGNMLSFVGVFEVVISGISAFIAFLLLFNLSKQ
ncbi:hypothetical protein HY045_01490 [Candidatus Woesebacteria bacterium]|nr:hypothetical protein [Candidatus Woesebacteria bacterium]